MSAQQRSDRKGGGSGGARKRGASTRSIPSRNESLRAWLKQDAPSQSGLIAAGHTHSQESLDRETLLLLAERADKIDPQAFRKLLDPASKHLTYKQLHRDVFVCLGLATRKLDQSTRAFNCSRDSKPGTKVEREVVAEVLLQRIQSGDCNPFSKLTPDGMSSIAIALRSATKEKNLEFDEQEKAVLHAWITERLPGADLPVGCNPLESLITTPPQVAPPSKPNVPVTEPDKQPPPRKPAHKSTTPSGAQPDGEQPLTTAPPPAEADASKPAGASSADKLAERMEAARQKLLDQLTTHLQKTEASALVELRRSEEAGATARAEADEQRRRADEQETAKRELDNRITRLEEQIAEVRRKAAASVAAQEALEADNARLQREVQTAERETLAAAARADVAEAAATAAKQATDRRVAGKELGVLDRRLKKLQTELAGDSEKAKAAIAGTPDDLPQELLPLRAAAKNLSFAVEAALRDLENERDRVREQARKGNSETP